MAESRLPSSRFRRSYGRFPAEQFCRLAVGPLPILRDETVDLAIVPFPQSAARLVDDQCFAIAGESQASPVAQESRGCIPPMLGTCYERRIGVAPHRLDVAGVSEDLAALGGEVCWACAKAARSRDSKRAKADDSVRKSDAFIKRSRTMLHLNLCLGKTQLGCECFRIPSL